MIVLGSFARIDAPVARHPKMEDQRVSTIRFDEAIFCTAAKAGDLRAGKPLPKINRQCAPKVAPARLDPRNSPAF